MKNELLTKGIILPSGEIGKDKINLVAGAITQPFAEMVWVTTGGDMETINRLTNVLVTMNNPTDRGKLFKIIKLLYRPLTAVSLYCSLQPFICPRGIWAPFGHHLRKKHHENRG